MEDAMKFLLVTLTASAAGVGVIVGFIAGALIF